MTRSPETQTQTDDDASETFEPIGSAALRLLELLAEAHLLNGDELERKVRERRS